VYFLAKQNPPPDRHRYFSANEDIKGIFWINNSSVA